MYMYTQVVQKILGRVSVWFVCFSENYFFFSMLPSTFVRPVFTPDESKVWDIK